MIIKYLLANCVLLIIVLALVINEVQLKEEITQVNQKIKTLFEEGKVDEIVKYYTEDCKFIFQHESQTKSGQNGTCGKIECSYSHKTHHYPVNYKNP